MIFVDANCFLRFLTEPATPEDRLNQQRAASLFASAKQSQVELTTSDAILAEVVFILTNPRHYNGTRELAAASLKSPIRPRGWRLHAKDVLLQALDVRAAHPKLSLPDAIAAAYSELRRFELATVDEALSRAPGVTAYAFE